MRRQDEATRVPTFGQPESDAFDATLEEASSASHSRVHPSLVALARALGRGAAAVSYTHLTLPTTPYV